MNHTQTMGMEVGHKAKDHMQERDISPYKKLFLISIAHFIVMYAVMYTMVDTTADVFLNVNNVYMTGMMLAPMVLLMPLTMKMMYRNKKINSFIWIGSAVVFVAFYTFMRTQAFVGDKQFVRSMIPHHSGAVLMCQEAKIADAELKDLCSQIIKSQISEIDQMKKIFNRL